ncbi:MAG: flagellar hook-basal body complex protein FliE [Deferribacterales bacterium]
MSDINSINFLLPNKLDTGTSSAKTTESAGESVDFAALLKDALKDVNDAQLTADDAVQKVLSGETKDISSTMIALQKADVSLKMMLEVRNKMMDAYQEIMRTQV